MCQRHNSPSGAMPRRDFMKTVGMAVAGVSLATNNISGSTVAENARKIPRTPTIIRGAFIYPPSKQLQAEGYYSWPGSTFDAEGRQVQYMQTLKQIEKRLGITIKMEQKPLDTAEDVEKFINEVQQTNPLGLLLIPFKKGHWEHVINIVEASQKPAVVLATLGVLLMPMVRQLHTRPGVYMINSPDNLAAVENGLKMIQTHHWLQESRIVNINGTAINQLNVPDIGTQVRTIPHQKNAKEIVEPTQADVLEAAKTYFVLKDLIQKNHADALMMNCLPGLKRPHQHVPPCMGYMNLRDEGIAMGCESDLDATLTMMLLQHLFGRPGFQHNPSVDTEKNSYFGAHCTAPSKMNGLESKPEPYILRNHAEAGWGTVPRVLMQVGQEVTIAKYLSIKNSDARPQMLLYSGEIIGIPPNPPVGGCRTNVETTINELKDVCELKGHHLILVYGNYTKALKTYCQLFGIEVVV